MTEVEIRAAVLGDGRALAALNNRAWSSDSDVAGRPPADRAFFGGGPALALELLDRGKRVERLTRLAGRLRGAAPRPGEILVAVPSLRASDAGQIAGYIRLVLPTALPSNAHVRQMQGLAVDPALRGRGIGRALIDAACERASSQGARRITLKVLSSNATARRLYAAAGFTVEGVLPGEFHIAGHYVDDILMGRPLT